MGDIKNVEEDIVFRANAVLNNDTQSAEKVDFDNIDKSAILAGILKLYREKAGDFSQMPIYGCVDTSKLDSNDIVAVLTTMLLDCGYLY